MRHRLDRRQNGAGEAGHNSTGLPHRTMASDAIPLPHEGQEAAGSQENAKPLARRGS